MSGGRFGYAEERLTNELFGYVGEKLRINPFEDKEISELVWDVLNLIHDFDLYVSADICEETYLKKKEAFKKKWFKTERKDRIRKIIDSTLQDAKEELYKTFGIVEQKG